MVRTWVGLLGFCKGRLGESVLRGQEDTGESGVIWGFWIGTDRVGGVWSFRSKNER